MKSMTISRVARHPEPIHQGLTAAVLERCGLSPLLNLSVCTAWFAVLGLLCAAPALTAQEVSSEANDALAADGTVSGPDISKHVSPNLNADEWALVRTYMNALPLHLREQINGMPTGSFRIAIVEGGTGVIHYNMPEDAGSFEVQSGPPLPGDEHPFAAGESANPEVTPDSNPGLFGGSGPYRRVYTTPVLPEPPLGASGDTEYNVGGVVTTACKAGNFGPLGTKDVGYAYLGGWSAGWGSLPKGLASDAVVDAGLQYNLGASNHDDYSLFMNIGGKIISPSSAGIKIAQPPHIVCGGVTGLEFRVFANVPQFQKVEPACYIGSAKYPESLAYGPNPACDTYALMLIGKSKHFNGHLGHDIIWAIEWVAPTWNDGGWAKLTTSKGYWEGKYNVTLHSASAPCGGCIFKWMTSIAQKHQNLQDASTYSATWSDRSISGAALNGDSSIEPVPITPAITDCSEYPLWIPPYGQPYNADCKDTPAGLNGLAQSITVKNYSATGETDTITLNH
jgi:hypothetical protein